MNEEELGDLKEMFNSRGWVLLIEDIKNDLEQIKEGFQYIEDSNKLHFNRGQCRVLSRLINLKGTVELQQGYSDEDI